MTVVWKKTNHGCGSCSYAVIGEAADHMTVRNRAVTRAHEACISIGPSKLPSITKGQRKAQYSDVGFGLIKLFFISKLGLV